MKKMPTRLCCSFDITSLFEFSLWFAFLFEFSLWFGHDKQTFGTTISSNFRWLYTSIWSKKLRVIILVHVEWVSSYLIGSVVLLLPASVLG
ncbi:uncharacterized protein LOC132306465 isoform X3 [Cornus florida]|uniref:uncharacterized protein LOC132306465 isoform X3 n=1 Tax=Cornus florida TaxID=4283 RepID=UPI00289E0846|nr:uncharacterized protein LOC132306465 isoform X3 [Cornus florida]